MKYLYKINSSYDGFTPQKIEERMKNGTLVYKWREYFDDLEKGDIIFTYFVGPKVVKGIYLIAKVLTIRPNRQVKCRVLHHHSEKPLVPEAQFKKYEKKIITKRLGSVYVIPPSLDKQFESFYKKEVVSELYFDREVKCEKCYERKSFRCGSCRLFNPNVLIKWDNEISRRIPGIKEIAAPFWIIPRQQHWMKESFSNHNISDAFYSFKAGYCAYSRLFAHGIMKAIRNHPELSRIKFDCLAGIPLSPKKKKNGELDRVSELCKIISKESRIPYMKNGLSLHKSISRRLYKLMGKQQSEFVNRYSQYLTVNPSLKNKKILLIDDVITDGITLRTIAEAIRLKYPETEIYAATAGIMAKKQNMTPQVVRKFSYH